LGVPLLLVLAMAPKISAKATGKAASALCWVRSWSVSALSSWSFTHKLRKASRVAMLDMASMTSSVGNANPRNLMHRLEALCSCT
jgi:hypothetical protein